MIRNFFKIFAEFTLFCFLFVAKTSFGSLAFKGSFNDECGGIRDSLWFAVGLVAEKTQLVYAENDHSVNKTTRKRYCVNEGVVVG